MVRLVRLQAPFRHFRSRYWIARSRFSKEEWTKLDTAPGDTAKMDRGGTGSLACHLPRTTYLSTSSRIIRMVKEGSLVEWRVPRRLRIFESIVYLSNDQPPCRIVFFFWIKWRTDDEQRPLFQTSNHRLNLSANLFPFHFALHRRFAIRNQSFEIHHQRIIKIWKKSFVFLNFWIS